MTRARMTDWEMADAVLRARPRRALTPGPTWKPRSPWRAPSQAAAWRVGTPMRNRAWLEEKAAFEAHGDLRAPVSWFVVGIALILLVSAAVAMGWLG